MVAAAALTLFTVVFLTQLVVGAYLQGVARAAADEGVRAGSRVAAGPEACQQAAGHVLAGLAPGPLIATAAVTCTHTGGDLVSQVTFTVDSPTPGLPTFTITATGYGTQEIPP